MKGRRKNLPPATIEASAAMSRNSITAAVAAEILDRAAAGFGATEPGNANSITLRFSSPEEGGRDPMTLSEYASNRDECSLLLRLVNDGPASITVEFPFTYIESKTGGTSNMRISASGMVSAKLSKSDLPESLRANGGGMPYGGYLNSEEREFLEHAVADESAITMSFRCRLGDVTDFILFDPAEPIRGMRTPDDLMKLRPFFGMGVWKNMEAKVDAMKETTYNSPLSPTLRISQDGSAYAAKLHGAISAYSYANKWSSNTSYELYDKIESKFVSADDEKRTMWTVVVSGFFKNRKDGRKLVRRMTADLKDGPSVVPHLTKGEISKISSAVANHFSIRFDAAASSIRKRFRLGL